MKTMTLALAVLLFGCGNSSPVGGGDDVDAAVGGDGMKQIDAPATGGAFTVFTIVLENHDYAEIVGSSNAPYINSLIAQGGLATKYKDTIHPSLGNYLFMISGANQYAGFIDLDPVTVGFFPVDKPNLGTQLQTAGVKWRSYQESMGTPCRLTSSGKYAPKHDPFLYFTDMQTGPSDLCKQTNVDYSQFAADLATNDYRYMWITPNLDSDGHDPSGDPVAALKHSDMWMSQEVPKILASDGYNNGGVLLILWDEAAARNGDDPDQVPMIVVSKKIKQAGMTTATPMDHGAYLATVEELLELPRLATVTTSPTLMDMLNP
jgi:hypothetical protein